LGREFRLKCGTGQCLGAFDHPAAQDFLGAGGLIHTAAIALQCRLARGFRPDDGGLPLPIGVGNGECCPRLDVQLAGLVLVLLALLGGGIGHHAPFEGFGFQRIEIALAGDRLGLDFGFDDRPTRRCRVIDPLPPLEVRDLPRGLLTDPHRLGRGGHTRRCGSLGLYLCTVGRLLLPLKLGACRIDLALQLGADRVGRAEAETRDDDFRIRIPIEPGLAVKPVEAFNRLFQRIRRVRQGIADARLRGSHQIGSTADGAFDDLKRDAPDRTPREIVDQPVPGTTDLVERFLGRR
jgi:hypothetical protein